MGIVDTNKLVDDYMTQTGELKKTVMLHSVSDSLTNTSMVLYLSSTGLIEYTMRQHLQLIMMDFFIFMI